MYCFKYLLYYIKYLYKYFDINNIPVMFDMTVTGKIPKR